MAFPCTALRRCDAVIVLHTHCHTHITAWAVEPVVDAFLVQAVQVECEGDHVVGNIFTHGLTNEHNLVHCLCGGQQQV